MFSNELSFLYLLFEFNTVRYNCNNDRLSLVLQTVSNLLICRITLCILTNLVKAGELQPTQTNKCKINSTFPPLVQLCGALAVLLFLHFISRTSIIIKWCAWLSRIPDVWHFCAIYAYCICAVHCCQHCLGICARNLCPTIMFTDEIWWIQN